MGARALKETISRPSLDPVELEDRWDAVEELIDETGSAGDRCGRSSTGSATSSGSSEDLGRHRGPAGRRRVRRRDSSGSRASSGPARRSHRARIRRSIDGLPDVADLVGRIEGALAPDPPALASAAGVIRAGADAELDSLRELRRDAQGALLAIEAEERRRSGISTLKIRFNRVFGYSLEVGDAHRDRVPADWIRRQSLANAERFVDARAEGAGRKDPRRRGADRRDRVAPLRRAARGSREEC